MIVEKILLFKNQITNLKFRSRHLKQKLKLLKKVNRSPYQLRSKKRRFVETTDKLSYDTYLNQSVPENEKNKIKAAESIIESIVKQLPNRRKKLKFNLEDTNIIKITEL